MFDLIFCPLNDCWEKGCYYIYTALYDDNPAVLYMTIYAQTPGKLLVGYEENQVQLAKSQNCR